MHWDCRKRHGFCEKKEPQKPRPLRQPVMRALCFFEQKMKIDYSRYIKFFIVYFYGIFILNIVSIFYMDRANNSLDDQVEFWATIILPIFIALLFVIKSSEISFKQIILSLVGLFIGAPVVFFAHVALNL